MRKLIALLLLLTLVISVSAHDDHDDHEDHHDHGEHSILDDLKSALDEDSAAGVLIFTGIIGVTSIVMIIRNLREVIRSG